MKRKVIKLGRATLVASLPSKWVSANNIEPGDEIELSERGRDLVIATEKRAAKITKEIDIKALNTRLIASLLEAGYLAGVDEITLFHEPMTTEYKTNKKIKTTEFIQKYITPLIGIEIIEQTETRTRIRDLGGISEEEMDNVLRRLFLLIKSMGEECLDGIKNNDKDMLRSIGVRFDNIYKFNLYFRRNLQKKGYRDFRKTSVMYEMVSTLDVIARVYKFVAVETLSLKKPYSKEALKVFAFVNKAFDNFYKVYYSFKPEKALDITKDREEAWRMMNSAKAKCAKEDAILYGRLGVIIVIISHLLKGRMTLEL